MQSFRLTSEYLSLMLFLNPTSESVENLIFKTSKIQILYIIFFYLSTMYSYISKNSDSYHVK